MIPGVIGVLRNYGNGEGKLELPAGLRLFEGMDRSGGPGAGLTDDTGGDIGSGEERRHLVAVDPLTVPLTAQRVDVDQQPPRALGWGETSATHWYTPHTGTHWYTLHYTLVHTGTHWYTLHSTHWYTLHSTHWYTLVHTTLISNSVLNDDITAQLRGVNLRGG